jgi:hypothetical protein
VKKQILPLLVQNKDITQGMPSSEFRHVTFERSDFLEEVTAAVIRVTRISELCLLAVISNRSTLRSVLRLLVIANVPSADSFHIVSVPC